MNKQTINNYTEKKNKGEYKGFIDESNTYKTLPEKEVLLLRYTILQTYIDLYDKIINEFNKLLEKIRS